MRLLSVLFAAHALAAEPITVSYVLGHGAPDWTLDGRELSAPRVTNGVFSSDRVDPRDIGLRSSRQRPPELDRTGVVSLLAGGVQVCTATVEIDEDGAVVGAGVEGCDPLLAQPVEDAVQAWKWVKRSAGERQVRIGFRLTDSWWLEDEGCVVQYQVFGSGTPILLGDGAAQCRVEPSQATVALPAVPGAGAAACVATLTVPGDEPAEVSGCPEPWGEAWAKLLSTWTFRPHRGEPTSYRAVLHIVAR